MNTTWRLSRLAYAVVIGTSLCGAARAASDATEAFTSNVRVDVEFLLKASAMAETNAASAAVVAFAKAQSVEQSGVLRLLDTPRDALDQNVATSGALETGRSAATSGMTTFAPSSGVMMSAAAMTLDRLMASKREAFDALYKSTVGSVLDDLGGLYETYALTGDDPVLRMLAGTELPKIRGARAAL